MRNDRTAPSSRNHITCQKPYLHISPRSGAWEPDSARFRNHKVPDKMNHQGHGHK